MEYDFDKKIHEERFHEIYNQLIDETENRLTLRHRTKNQRLKDLLELFEYLRGEEDVNPLNQWFDDSHIDF